ncbi:uncharacterized protein EDB93DRAFT_1245013 [Suillus bovinus]|uniref:uncharacterized protein n=1 Tax=Suillus bovinus TaxID=48563 RepID=UPI001B86BAF1|nr:uncharacterized protein EDB93DRAFT_1245013 [Suillus bovinus]KAG2159197.1 hypothetical protein EDB93DRAFT_1245013 [Suillus bovinus]
MPIFQFSGHLSNVFLSASALGNDALNFGSWMISNAPVRSEGNGSLSTHISYGGPYSAHSDSHHNPKSTPAPDIAIAITTAHSESNHTSESVPAPDIIIMAAHSDSHHNSTSALMPDTAITTAQSKDADHFKGIMKKYPKWRLVLSYLWLLIRVAICKGETGNPHFITTASLETKAAMIHGLFTESLTRANISNIEEVTSTSDSRTLSENEVLAMVGPWVSQFIHNTRCMASQIISHPRAGFGLHDIFGTLLKARLEHLLDHFMRPHSIRLLFDQNRLVWIFHTQCIKSILWHIVFRVTISNGVTAATTPSLPQIVADLDPNVFRNTSVLPVETLAFIQLFCYLALLRELEGVVAQIPGATFDQPIYPSAATVYEEAIETLNILLPLDSDPGHSVFMTCMASLIEDTEDALGSWLWTHGLELPDSLFATAAVLFGLVDYCDLTLLLENFFHKEGIISWGDRMHHAQTEVLLFSTAIVNLCEVLNTRGQPSIVPKLLPPVNTVGYTSAYKAPSLLDCKHFQPTKDIQDKCCAWLITSSPFQDTVEVGSDASQTPPESPRHHQYPLRHDDQLLSMPHLTNALVGNVKFGTYINTSFEDKTLDELMSVFHILDLKKQWAQAEVDMFSEAIVLNAELEFTDDGTSSGKVMMYDSRLHDDWFDDWVSTSSAPSNTS